MKLFNDENYKTKMENFMQETKETKDILLDDMFKVLDRDNKLSEIDSLC